ncbi:unnamed protein product [Orchesella dallaii]|uniref:Uncharacterized protein n=1 Tax=Orchesella dallaii TaxID=48710 RepID=A0ABP1RQV8_9HEXA
MKVNPRLEVAKPGVCQPRNPHPPTQEKPESPKIEVPPINSKRLRPLRQKSKNVVLNILDSGEVCLEFLRIKGRAEKVVEVLRISSDGLRIVIYHPNKGKGVTLSEQPPRLPAGGADAIYNYENIPQKHWKKYMYASRFVDIVKTKTAKVIYYSMKAKCFLMENGPNPDFEAAFYEGAKVNKSGGQVKIVDTNGWTGNVHITTDAMSFTPSVKLLWDHYKSCLCHCLNIERTMEEMSLSTEQDEDVFPIIVGRRPVCTQRALQSLNKENMSPISAISVPVVGAYEPSIASSRRRPSSKNNIFKQVHVPNIGHAVQMTSGVVCIQYADSTKLFVEPSSSKVSFTDSNGRLTHYQQNDFIPHETRGKLEHLPIVFEALMNTS